MSQTRRLGHAHTLPTAPAYSFGGRHNASQGDTGPGPGEYVTDLNWQKGPGGFGSATRYSTPPARLPSSQDYRPERSARTVLHSAAEFSMAGASRPEHRNMNPGPGAYDPDPAENQVKPGTAALSIALRVQTGGDAERAPGPDAYSPSSPTHGGGRSASLKFRHPHSGGGDGPGPAAYNTRPRISQSAGKSFGVSPPRIGHANGVPGPGMYTGPDEAVRGHRAAWALGARLPAPRSPDGPGPGTYSLEPLLKGPVGRGAKSENPNAPSWSFKGRPGVSLDPQTPAGTDYKPLDWMRKSAPAFSFRGTTVKDHGAWVPGPGAYDSHASGPTFRNSAPITVATRYEDCGVQDPRPGPQAYYLPKPSGGKPGVSLKFRHVITKRDGGPSPAEYGVVHACGQDCTTCPSKGFSFGLRPPVSQREDVPGPMYQVGVSTLGVAGAPRMELDVMDGTLVL